MKKTAQSVCVMAVLGLVVPLGVAQPQVPPGFTIRKIAPLLDGQIPQLEAIDDPQFGTGVVAATANNGVASIRLITSAGTIVSLASVISPDNVARVRFDHDGLIDGNIHFTLSTNGAGSITNYYTLNRNGVVTNHWTETGDVFYDFDLTPIGVTEKAVLLDANGMQGTRLSTLDTALVRTLRSANSLPSGRIDTDVRGLRGDPAGVYGGEMIFADSDCNDSGLSAVWSVSGILSGGTYTAVSGVVPCSQRLYGDLDFEQSGPFGGIAFVTEQVSEEIQQVAPDGTHTTWATGFVEIDALSISPDGESMYVADLNGIWLIRTAGVEPGAAVISTDPSVPSGTPMTGSPVTTLRTIFSEPVTFTDADVTITDGDGLPVPFDASGSGSQFMIIGLGQPLEGDTYTITIADTVTSVATGQPLDGDNDGIAGGDYVFTLTHVDRTADLDADGDVDVFDFEEFQLQFTGPRP